MSNYFTEWNGILKQTFNAEDKLISETVYLFAFRSVKRDPKNLRNLNLKFNQSFEDSIASLYYKVTFMLLSIEKEVAKESNFYRLFR